MKAVEQDRIGEVVNVADLTSEFVKYGCVRLPKLLDDETVRVIAQESQRLLAGESQQLEKAVKFFDRQEWESLLWTARENVTILYDILEPTFRTSIFTTNT
ncbi:hypothetical protein [Chamaesiphon sp.]|uniref:hypothetical protein n=1 Tax=Chamaesiphon sp. TaxID=2814140 RepID=UPI003593AB83